MRRLMLISSVVMLLMGLLLGGMASADVLDFEDLYTGGETFIFPIASPYHGFTMSTYASFITKGYIPNSGFDYGTTGHGSMFTANDNSISLSGSPFNVVQLDVTSAWLTGENATFQGWKGGSLIYTTYVTGLSYTGPTTVSLNYTDIDTLVIIPGTGTLDTTHWNQLGYYPTLPAGHLDIDNIIYNTQVPLPPGLVLLGTGLLGLGALGWWRQHG